MHAYLIVGSDPKPEADKLITSLGANVIEFNISKVEDVRLLQKEIKLKLLSPTVYLIQNIGAATESAVNAFLKNLEEPQENLTFILTNENEHDVLPTIVSRCQIIYSQVQDKQQNESEVIEFIKMETSEKIKKIDEIKERTDAKIFLKTTIKSLHQLLHKYPVRSQVLAKYLESFVSTLNNIEGNGNVNLQLTNMVLSLV